MYEGSVTYVRVYQLVGTLYTVCVLTVPTVYTFIYLLLTNKEFDR